MSSDRALRCCPEPLSRQVPTANAHREDRKQLRSSRVRRPPEDPRHGVPSLESLVTGPHRGNEILLVRCGLTGPTLGPEPPSSCRVGPDPRFLGSGPCSFLSSSAPSPPALSRALGHEARPLFPDPHSLVRAAPLALNCHPWPSCLSDPCLSFVAGLPDP